MQKEALRQSKQPRKAAKLMKDKAATTKPPKRRKRGALLSSLYTICKAVVKAKGKGVKPFTIDWQSEWEDAFNYEFEDYNKQHKPQNTNHDE